VTTTDDDLTPNRNCTLREAVQPANTNHQVDQCPAGSTRPDTITLPAGTYTLTLAGEGENNNQTGDLDILEAVTISGDKDGATIINGNGLDRVLHLHNVDVVINWLTITGGASSAGMDHGSGGDGGGIHQDGGTLSLSHSQVMGNHTGESGTGGSGGAGGDGGGIYCY
jgi:CSLREA domain-containing protein